MGHTGIKKKTYKSNQSDEISWVLSANVGAAGQNKVHDDEYRTVEEGREIIMISLN